MKLETTWVIFQKFPDTNYWWEGHIFKFKVRRWRSSQTRTPYRFRRKWQRLGVWAWSGEKYSDLKIDTGVGKVKNSIFHDVNNCDCKKQRLEIMESAYLKSNQNKEIFGESYWKFKTLWWESYFTQWHAFFIKWQLWKNTYCQNIFFKSTTNY